MSIIYTALYWLYITWCYIYILMFCSDYSDLMKSHQTAAVTSLYIFFIVMKFKDLISESALNRPCCWVEFFNYNKYFQQCSNQRNLRVSSRKPTMKTTTPMMLHCLRFFPFVLIEQTNQDTWVKHNNLTTDIIVQ